MVYLLGIPCIYILCIVYNIVYSNIHIYVSITYWNITIFNILIILIKYNLD